MRKVTLCARDLELFDTDITFAEFEFITKHWDAFRRMWKEQGHKFWIKFIVTFRNVAGEFGVIKSLPEINEKYTTIMDETFIFIHEQFVESKYRGARNFLEQILFLAQNKGMMQHITQKSFSKDPFYNKETRDCFRFLFGPPTERISYLKTCVLHDLYTKFGGAVCKCLKRWLEAEEVDPKDDTFWNQAGPVCEPFHQAKQAVCPYCRFFIGLEGPRNRSNHHVTTFIYEKRSGFGCGPWFVPGWPLHKDPRIFDSKNPLYDLGCDALVDWRSGLSYTEFRNFVEYVKKHYPSPADSDLKADPADDLDDETVELLKSLFEAGIGDSILESLPINSSVDNEKLAEIVNSQMNREKLLNQCEQLEAKMTNDTNQSTRTHTTNMKTESALKEKSVKVGLIHDKTAVSRSSTLNWIVSESTKAAQTTNIGSVGPVGTKQALNVETGLASGSALDKKIADPKGTNAASTIKGKIVNGDERITRIKPAANRKNATTQTTEKFQTVPVPSHDARQPELHNKKLEKLFQKAEAGDIFARIKIDRVMIGGEKLSDDEEDEVKSTGARPKQDICSNLDQRQAKTGATVPNDANKKQHRIQQCANLPKQDLSSNLSPKVDKVSVTAPNDINKKQRQLQQCANCRQVEPAPKTFKICQRCKSSKSAMSRYYCGRSCQLDDWKQHKLDHGST